MTSNTMSTRVVVLLALAWTAMYAARRLDAQQTAGAVHAGPSSATAATSFDAVYPRWTQLLAKLRQIDEAYRNARPEQRETLRAEYTRLIDIGNSLQDDLIRAAAVTYASNPTSHRELALFLRGVVYQLTSHEDYEEALRTGQLLVDNYFEDGSVYDLCGVCAFTVNEFRLAEQHFSQAKKADALSPVGAQRRAQLPYYKDAWDRETERRTAERTAGNLPRVLLLTSQGEIELELFENEAPVTVANFLQLVADGFYDGLEFYRVTACSTAVSGCPEGDGTGGPGYTIASECSRPDHRLHFRGSVGMVRSGPWTHGSQFYLTFAPAQDLDNRQTVFARVIRGIEVLARLQRREPRDPLSERMNPHANIVIPPADTIIRATVVRKGNDSHESPRTPQLRAQAPPSQAASQR